MNTIQKSMVVCMMLLLHTTLQSQNIKVTTVPIKGVCEMCKEVIEGTVSKTKNAKGIWNMETHLLTISYDTSKTTINSILQNIAKKGYDNDLYKATATQYKNLPECCKYDRKTGYGVIDKDIKEPTSVQQIDVPVRGSCGMCKETIESTVSKFKSAKGIWNSERELLTVSLDTTQTTIDQILKAIADNGYDNIRYKATDEKYNSMAKCCHYDRSKPFANMQVVVELPKEIIKTDTPKAVINQPEVKVDTVTKLATAVVTGKQNSTSISTRSASLTQNITGRELLKAACCNLSESFSTNATVDVNFTNAITGTKQIKLLGLDQKYTLLTKELLPEIRGLALPFGMNFIPGRWIQSIQLTKGGGTVANGYEGITGQINTELLKFKKENKTDLNLFADGFSRAEANVTYTGQIDEHKFQTILLHGNARFAKVDRNNDHFLDNPIGKQINFTYLFEYNDVEHTNLESMTGVNFLIDNRQSGSIHYDKSKDFNTTNNYGVNIDIDRLQVWNKTGYVFKGKEYQSIGFVNQFTYHQQKSNFGLRKYNGEQRTYYTNLLFESIIGNSNHKYKAGASFMLDDYKEHYNTTHFNRTEKVPGLFAEYTLHHNKLTLVSGIRSDFHNLAGTQISPRINVKYDLTEKTIFRAAAGRGFRTANVFAENQQYFASNRAVVLPANTSNGLYGLQPEVAWNYGLSFQKDFSLATRKSSIVVDFFRTDFTNQVVVDLDQSAQQIQFYNLHGQSYANSFQIQWDLEPVKQLELRMAYKYYDVKTTYHKGLRTVPFAPNHRGFFNIAYTTPATAKNRKWNFDATLQYVGKQRIPDLGGNPSAFRLKDMPKPFTTLNAQAAFFINKKTRLYMGAENITGFMQHHPIIDHNNPFSNYFDGGMVWGPIMPTNIYFGIDIEL